MQNTECLETNPYRVQKQPIKAQYHLADPRMVLCRMLIILMIGYGCFVTRLR